MIFCIVPRNSSPATRQQTKCPKRRKRHPEIRTGVVVMAKTMTGAQRTKKDARSRGTSETRLESEARIETRKAARNEKRSVREKIKSVGIGREMVRKRVEVTRSGRRGTVTLRGGTRTPRIERRRSQL